jgi:hypothetical protein
VELPFLVGLGWISPRNREQVKVTAQQEGRVDEGGKKEAAARQADVEKQNNAGGDKPMKRFIHRGAFLNLKQDFIKGRRLLKENTASKAKMFP